MDKIYLGKITGFHGIKGELKIKSDFEKPNLVFQNGFKLYINDLEYNITSYRKHKEFNLVSINDLKDLNLVNHLIGFEVYINRDDLNLSKDEYLVNDLIGFTVYDNEDIIGIVKEIRNNKVSNYLYCDGDKSFYIPIINEYIKQVDTENKKIYTYNGKELII